MLKKYFKSNIAKGSKRFEPNIAGSSRNILNLILTKIKEIF